MLYDAYGQKSMFADNVSGRTKKHHPRAPRARVATPKRKEIPNKQQHIGSKNDISG
jgi:hypothetical protein